MWLKASLFAFDCGMPDSYLQRNSYKTPAPTYVNDAGKSDVNVPLQHQLGHQLGIHDVQIVWVEEVQVHLNKAKCKEEDSKNRILLCREFQQFHAVLIDESKDLIMMMIGQKNSSGF